MARGMVIGVFAFSMAHFSCCKDWYLVGKRTKTVKQFEKLSNFYSQHKIQKVVGERALNRARKRYLTRFKYLGKNILLQAGYVLHINYNKTKYLGTIL